MFGESITAPGPGPAVTLADLAITPQEIPDKLYFRIGDVAKLAGIKPYVLRYWETEFAGLGPKKSGTGHRLYRRKDVEMVLRIKQLLYEKRFTIEGARKALEAAPPAQKATSKPGKSQAARTAAAKARSSAVAPPVSSAGQGQAALFDVSSPLASIIREELEAIARILR